MSAIRVLLADDHILVRAGIRSLLQGLSAIRVIAEAEDGRQALDLVREQRPDVVLMDISMPGMNGLEALRRITREFKAVRVVILSMHPSEEYVLEAVRAGASGYLLKDSSPTELELCVRAVAQGGTYFTPRVSKQVIADYFLRLSGESTPPTVGQTPFQRLTPRQREVLLLIAEGRTSPEIAQILGVGVRTIETHRTMLMRRLNIHDIAGLVRYAMETGIVTSDQIAVS
jgi:DNA-binding NarL/FixJ family response regulator